jgi:NitT/TauT family transport system ATP-binding protein
MTIAVREKDMVAEAGPVLVAENLGYTFPGADHPVFEGVDLALAKGEFVSLVGGSGVGKSTVLRCAAGLLNPSAGTISLQGEGAKRGRRRSIVFQDSRLLPWRTVEANVAYGLHGLGLSGREIANRVEDALKLTLMADYAKRWPSELSGGQQQRVGIARALAVEPSILLMDEPFSAVDALTRGKLQDELLNIWERRRMAVLFVTHDIEEAVLLSDRILVMGDMVAGERPARITDHNPVDLVRPRSRKAPEFFRVAASIADQLR